MIRDQARLILGSILCGLRGKHGAYRRARKGEDAALKYCVRCGSSVAVKTRKKGAATEEVEARDDDPILARINARIK